MSPVFNVEDTEQNVVNRSSKRLEKRAVVAEAIETQHGELNAMKKKTMIRFSLAVILFFGIGSPIHAQSAESAEEKMMAPTEVLTKEHQLIEKMVVFAGTIATRIREGDTVELEKVNQLHDFFKHFADECHHAKEEDLLFPMLKKLDVDPVVVNLLVKQHEEGRILLGGIAGILDKTEGSLSSVHRKALAEYLSHYSQLMERHIKLENEYLWPKVSQTLNKDAKDELAGEFHRVEIGLGEGFHEKYHAMALKLLNESGDE